MSANSTTRLAKELKDIEKMQLLHSIVVDRSDLYKWQGLVLPTQAPYKTGAFKVEVKFPPEYPFKPPTVTFKTSIYHPNIDEKGQVCLSSISVEHWKPATRAEKVLTELLDMVNNPQVDHPLRPELAKELSKDRKKFLKQAEEFTKKHSEPRPADQ